MNVKLWLDRLKNYLIDCEMARSRWTRIALSFVGDDVLARLVDLGRTYCCFGQPFNGGNKG
ncbi:hypothetical protein T07_5157 [Trichinella nelsoni]|uniref:Uncharacterized protein n=1 Tax=Trichinella nelsoni TaxID=6336 RepID=A0A0V0RY07_9BILA|nr:hypothetical protein T07_5157 [Trichinella nelsoni]